VLDDLDAQVKHIEDAQSRKKAPRDYNGGIKVTLRQYKIIREYIENGPPPHTGQRQNR
jgi:hypothetical protein